MSCSIGLIDTKRGVRWRIVVVTGDVEVYNNSTSKTKAQAIKKLAEFLTEWIVEYPPPKDLKETV